MVDFIRKRLQVFVSSTFEDLKQERQAAVEAILSAGHIPAGMELFAAGDESQMDVIKQWIDQSDVYLLILGGRYGSIEPRSGKSYIHLEYEYALERKKAVFACAIADEALEHRVRKIGTGAIEKAEPKKLAEFRTLVLSKISRFWSDSKDIKLAIHETLNGLSRRQDLPGWIRADQQANVPVLADEIARLSKENAQLRNQIEQSSSQIMIGGLTIKEIKEVLESKGLTQVFLASREELESGKCNLEDPEAKPLELLGLISPRVKWGGGASYGLTDAGRVFFNRLDLEALRN